MEDIFKTAGSTQSTKPDAGGAVIRNVPVFGVVKNNIDPTRAGRIQVYISDIGGDDPDDPNNWATVSYMSPFYGLVEATAGEDSEGSYVGNSVSYGVWNSPPDLNSTVICIFINGDPNFGFYIGCAPKPESLHMVPAIGAAKMDEVTFTNSEDQSYGGAEQVPVTNINTNNESLANSDGFLTAKKPIHSYLAAIMFKQGILRDSIRGPITTGAQRESPSRVGWGVSSPGRPIYAGGYTDATIAKAAKEGKDDNGLAIVSRRAGHSIVMDDGDLIGRDQLVRIRSAAGHQILMSDDGQTIFIIHSNGQSWVELGKEGTIDMFCTNSFNVRTQGDINLHADNNINIHAKKKLNLKAEDIYLESEKSTSCKIGTDYKVQTTGKYHLKVGDVMSLASGGAASFLSTNTTFINGSRINLNTGEGPVPDEVAPIPEIVHTDTLFDSVKGFLAAPGALQSITTRTPAHAPWINANQGVNIQTNSNSDSALASAPSSEVAKVNNVSASTPPVSTLSSAALSTVPAMPSVSSSITPQTTGAIVGAMATNVATGPAAAAAAAGIGSIPTTNGIQAVVGKFAQTPAQLESAGILKPGSSSMVNALVEKGTSLTQAFPQNIFTGQAGITNITGFMNSASAQIESVTTNLQKAQTSLTNVGVLTGKESPTAIAGLVMAGVTSGINDTVNAVKNVGSNIAKGLGLSSVGSQNPTLTAMNAGNFAANAAQSSIGGLAPIINTILPVAGLIGGVKLQQKGAVAAAFATVAASLGTLSKPNTTDPLKAAAGLISKTGQILGGKVGATTNALTGGLNSLSQLASGKGSFTQQLSSVSNIVGSIGKIGAITGNSSLAKTASSLTKSISKAGAITNNLSTINKGLSAISLASDPRQTLGGITSILGAAGRTGSILGNTGIAKTALSLSKVTTNSSKILSAVNALSSSKDINQTLGAAGSILSSVNNISKAVSGNSKSTGLFKIPGGSLSVGSLVNASLGSIGIPKNPALGSVISGAVTSAINQVAFPKVMKNTLGGITSGTTPSTPMIAGLATGVNNLAGGFASAASGVSSSIQSGIQGLAGMTLGGLSSAASGALSSTLSSIGFGGANALKIATAAIDTNDVLAINSQVNAVIEDSRVPKPVFGDLDKDSAAELESILQKNEEVGNLLSELDSLQTDIDELRENYYNLEQSLPPGDPSINEAKTQWTESVDQYLQALDAISNLINDDTNGTE